MRNERDFLGELDIDDDVFSGIHTKRAFHNFSIPYKKSNIEIIYALAKVKHACALANFETDKLSKEKADIIAYACEEIYTGKYDNEFTLPGLQGGAGTSTNMNMNEVITNIALTKMGNEKGNYTKLHPIEDVNLSQSTNDTYPTAIKIATIKLLRELVDEIMNFQMALQKKESEFANICKIGRTQLADALPLSLGDEFGAWAEAISRDRWRIYKVEERIRQINIGGTAIGTGVGASSKYKFIVTEKLRELTGYGLARAENLIDNTQNLDVFVEVSGLIKALAVNLSKISNDIRLMASGPHAGLSEITLPSLQVGSSIMAGKINPVLPEMIKQIYYKVVGNDLAITMACGDGEFELNAMTPIVADLLLENIELLTHGIKLFREKCIKGIIANEENCKKNLKSAWSVANTLIDAIGYEKLTEIIKESRKTGKSYQDILHEKGYEVKQVNCHCFKLDEEDKK